METRLYGRQRETEYFEKVLRSVVEGHGTISTKTANSTVTEDQLSEPTPRSVGVVPTAVQHLRWNCQMVLVCGAPGSGKRTFARSVLHQYQTESSLGSPFLLASGRFHPSQHDTSNASDVLRFAVDRPFSAIDEAIEELFHVAATESNEMMSIIHERLQMLGLDDIDVLSSLLPSMKRWLRRMSNPQTSGIPVFLSKASSEAPVMKPILLGSYLLHQQSQVWSPVLIRFFQALVDVLPVVLLFEDLQYADEASLILIEALMNQNESSSVEAKSQGLLIVATSRVEHAMSGSEMFTSFLQRCKYKYALPDSNAIFPHAANDVLIAGDTRECLPTSQGPAPNRCFHQITLSAIAWEDVFDWVQTAGEAFQKYSLQQKREIADLAFHHSCGNPLRLRYCLLSLEYDKSFLDQGGLIRKTRVPREIVDMYTAILLQQVADIQNLVRVAAAIAEYGDGIVHREVLEVSAEVSFIDTIIRARSCGLLEYIPTRKYIRFPHDDLQHVAYAGIPHSERAMVHLEIGRRIWRNSLENKNKYTEDEYIGNVLIATLQLQNSIHLLVDFEERLYMAQLCFEAGQTSSLLGDFHKASKLFEFGVLVLGPDLWCPDLYATSLVLHNAAAQAHYSIGAFEKMEVTLDLIFDNATSFRDKLSAYVILVYATGTRLKLLEAFRIACSALRELGEPVNQNPGTLTIIGHLIATKVALYGKSDSFFRNLPLADNADYLVVAQLLSFAMFFSYVAHAEIGILLCFRLVRLSFKHGITGPSVVAFASYGFLLAAAGDFEEGNRFGLLALDLVQKFEAWQPRVQMMLYGYTYYWVHPFRNCCEPLQQAQHSALLYGDLEVYSGSTSFYLLVQLCTASSLRTLEPFARSFCGSLDLYGQKNALIFALPLWGIISDLSGVTEPLAMSGEIKDVASALTYAVKEENKYVVGSFYTLRTMWYYLVGEYSGALQMAKKSVKYRQVSDHILTFYEALSSLALAWASQRLKRRTYRNRGRVLSQRVKGWARRCPDNFLNKQLLLEAENAALNGNSNNAIALFEQSIHKAKTEEFLHEEGIAHERLGRYQLHLGKTSNAMMSFESARAAFEKWGATALVRRMDTLIESL